MGSVRDYLEVHKVLRATLLLLAFVVASFALYASFSLGYVGTNPVPNFLWDRVLPLVFLFLTVASGLGIVWILRRPGRSSYWSTLALVSAVITLGAILTSVAIWREHWLELVK